MSRQFIKLSFARLRFTAKKNIHSILTFAAAFVFILPLIAILAKVDFTTTADWQHYRQFLLTEAVLNTVHISVLTLLLAGLIGTGLAVLVAFFEFPGKRTFAWLFYLPLAIPPYIAAYVYSGLLGYTGFLQKMLRAADISVKPSSFDIMNLNGAVLIFALTLYPYVYAPVRSFLERHSSSLVESARVLGYGPGNVLFRVILPLVRLPLVGGLSLLLMEVLSDYGVIRYFNIKTVGGLIFESWFGMGDTSIAIRLSFSIMVSILLLLLLEHVLRGRKRFNVGNGPGRPISPNYLTGCLGLAATAVSTVFLAVAFFVPMIQLASWSWIAMPKIRLLNLHEMIANSMAVSIFASAAIVILSIYFSQAQRRMRGMGQGLLSKIVQLGYSIPGAVIAIGAISLFTSIDGALQPLYQLVAPGSRKLVLSASLTMLLFAFVARYLAVGYNNVSAGFAKIGSGFGEAARTLGHSSASALLRIELPMMKSALVSGFILGFIDISKELPLTLLLRPFNFNTLASRIYEYANDERIHEASIPALILILSCMVGIMAMVRLQNGRKGSKLI